MTACSDRPLTVLVFTSLYPNTVQPRHGIFVEERLRHLVSAGGVFAKVVAPVPWFPSQHPLFGRYANFARVPVREVRYGIEILHPRYPVIPKIGMTVAPMLMTRYLTPFVCGIAKSGFHFDLIDAHYLYPDGVAAVAIGKRLRVPVVVTARGQDVNVIPQYRAARAQILRAVERAAMVITVSEALKTSLAALGASSERITVLRNGVDLQRFTPVDKAQARAQLGLSGSVWISVGHLIERKGHHLVIEAIARLPEVTLVVIGDGPLEAFLKTQAERLGVAQRVRFMGHVEHAQLATFYSTADAMVLASGNEGMPNVILEAMACGVPVIATPIGGIPEVVCCREAGELMTDRSASAIVQAWHTLTERQMSDESRRLTRLHAEQFDWTNTTQGQLALFRRIVCRTSQGSDAHVESDALSDPTATKDLSNC